MKTFILKISICLIFAFNHSISAYSQADLTLTITDLLNWQPPAGQSNVSFTPVHQREHVKNFQLSGNLDTNAKILYCPDGMDNFGPYIDSANKFNLFNFSHWQYIDILCWFGGSAGAPILIPSKSWVDAAHKNGVKVIGTIFMAPIAFGGSQAQVQSFLVQDSAGNFIAAQKLIQIANHFNFDGWILNFETSVNSTVGGQAAAFVNALDSAYAGEVIWYDAMLVNGSISYQNKLNANNAYFFQHSTGLFTNYNWTLASTVTSSATYATGLGLSPFNVYTGADMWPGRNAQTAFSDYTWIDNIITSGVAKTSIAMFAMNFTFNYGPFTNFNNDSTDYETFYSTERKIFSGLDEDPQVTDATWKGLCNYITVRTPIISFPFETDFNTGHGMNYFSNGNIISSTPWHNMSLQSYLPSWTFNKNGLSVDYNFDDAYSGGSSLNIHGSNGGTTNLLLYSTHLILGSNDLGCELALKSTSNTAIDSVTLEFQRGSQSSVFAVFHPALNGSWEHLISGISGLSSTDTIVAVNFVVYATDSFTIQLGKIGFDNSLINSISPVKSKLRHLKILQSFQEGMVEVINESDEKGELIIYNLKGIRVDSRAIRKQSRQIINLMQGQIYIYSFVTPNGNDVGRIDLK
jgi:endo-beta-N-acetylglucosaminidase D